MDILYGPPFGEFSVPLTSELTASIEATITALEPFVQYPPLLPEYLRQPQFPYMFDIITGVINRYGLLKSLYSPDELQSLRNRRSRHQRAKFFKKLLTALRWTTGEFLPPPNFRKLAIGHLPMVSNRLLQVIALALSHHMNSDEAVKRVNKVSAEGDLSRKRGMQYSVGHEAGFSSGMKRFRQGSSSSGSSGSSIMMDNIQQENKHSMMVIEREPEEAGTNCKKPKSNDSPKSVLGFEDFVCQFKAFT